jgi:hypothetical protein
VGGRGEEMTQTLYAHMNKIKIKKKERKKEKGPKEISIGEQQELCKTVLSDYFLINFCFFQRIKIQILSIILNLSIFDTII